MATEALIDRIRRAASPCIERQLATAGIEPSRFRLDDLASVPPLVPGLLDLDRLDDPVGELRLRDAPSPVRLGTSERADATIVLSWTARDLERSARRGAAMLRIAGIGPTSRVANTLEGGFTTPGSLALGDAVEALGALDVPLGPVRDERAAVAALGLIERIGVDVLVADGATGSALLSCLEARAPSSLHTLVWCGSGASPSGWKGALRRWIPVPEVSIFCMMSCREGTVHLDADVRSGILEGRVLLTSLAGDAPLLRFDGGLIAAGSGVACRCGGEGETLQLSSAAGQV